MHRIIHKSGAVKFHICLWTSFMRSEIGERCSVVLKVARWLAGVCWAQAKRIMCGCQRKRSVLQVHLIFSNSAWPSSIRFETWYQIHRCCDIKNEPFENLYRHAHLVTCLLIGICLYHTRWISGKPVRTDALSFEKKNSHALWFFTWSWHSSVSYELQWA